MSVKQLLVVFLMTLCFFKTNAQNVNIQLRNSGSTLEVWLIPKANYTGTVSSINFTISWEQAYNVDLAPSGAETVFVSSIPLQVTGNATRTTVMNGTKKYRTYGSSGGATAITLTNNAAFKIMSVAVPRTSNLLTGSFSISNDDFIIAKNLKYFFEMSGNDYTGTTSSTATNVTIPLELLRFNAVKQDNTAYLTWQTASEINFSHFEVERSIDAKSWIKIGELKGGNTEGGYFLIDDNAFDKSNNTLYRLKMVNTDGSVKYSNVETVEQKEATKGSLKLFPNPVGNVAHLIIDAPNETAQSIDIIDLVGKVYQHININVSKGQNQYTIDVQGLPSGMYLLKTANNRGLSVLTRFIKL
jgi:hypothetical protein